MYMYSMCVRMYTVGECIAGSWRMFAVVEAYIHMCVHVISMSIDLHMYILTCSTRTCTHVHTYCMYVMVFICKLFI